MNGKDLINVISKINALKDFFKGVFSINTMPKSLKKREFFFTNIDLSHGKGSHWICVLKNDKNEIELFDSLGCNEIKIEWFLKNNANFTGNLNYNTTPVQSPFSDTCGQFVLYFSLKRLLNIDYSFKKILNEIFDENCDENEIIVRSFINEILD